MHRRTFRTASLGLLTAGCGALALAAACSTPATPGPGAGGTNTQPGGAAGAGGAATAGVTGGGSAGAAVAGGVGPGGGTAGTPGGGGATGGGTGQPCAPVTQLNGSGLTVSAMDIHAFKFAPSPGPEVSKLAYDPIGMVVVILDGAEDGDGRMWSFDPKVALPTTAMTSPIGAVQPYNSGYAPAAGYGTGVFDPYRGLAFGPDGSLYVMAARGGGNVGVNVQKGAPPATPGGARTWTTIVTTSMGFAASGTDYDHSFSGMAVSADGMSLFINSGSRTEHGEVRGGIREVPLSSAIFKVPTTGMTDLKNDEAALAPFLFADGTRNAFDIEFNANGDLIGTENGPDIDLPDEVNFLEQGKHYGFPWRFGATDNPTRDAAYTRDGDKRLQAGYGAIESYVADPGFPAPPGAFIDPIMNMGPDANFERISRDAASPTQAAAGLAGVTGHRSPLGLAFDTAGALCGDYYKQGFMLSYGALVPASLNDPGEDLLFLNMTKGATGYTMTAKKVATGIKMPMDAVMVGNRLFTLSRGPAGQIYMFVLPTP